MEINADAPLVSRQEVTIAAPVEAVWRLQADIRGWPEWNRDITRAELSGPLAAGSIFRWETAGLSITSVLEEVVPPRRLAWRGEAGGVVAVHVWTFVPGPAGVQVVTEESWEGAVPPEQVGPLQDALDASLNRWLQQLKACAETP